MSVIAIPSRPYPPKPSRPSTASRRPTTGEPAGIAPGPGVAQLNLSIDIALGTETPGPALTRLLDLLGELVADGSGEITVTNAGQRSPDSWPGSGLSLAGPQAAGPHTADPVAAGPHTADPVAAGPRTAGPVAPSSVVLSPVRERIIIQAASRVVRRGRQVVPLTRREFDLLLFLAENPRRVFTRARLLTSVWGHRHALERTVDVHVRRLRGKIGADVPLVTTVHGVGYRLADDAPVSVDPTR